MIDPMTITTTATAIAAVIFNKAIEKGGDFKLIATLTDRLS
jgi:hypothetical protein